MRVQLRALAARALASLLVVGAFVAVARVAIGQVGDTTDAGADGSVDVASDGQIETGEAGSQAANEGGEEATGDALEQAGDVEVDASIDAGAVAEEVAVDAAITIVEDTLPPPTDAAPVDAMAAISDAKGSSHKSSVHYGAALEVAGYDDTDHVAVLTPSIAGHVEDPIAGWSVKGRYLVDVVSAASADIVSTASRRWNEVRHAGTLEGDYMPGAFGFGGLASVSTEPDYLSWSLGGRGRYEFDEKNEMLLFGFTHAHDTIGRTGTPFDVFSHSLDRNAFDVGASFVIDRSTVFTLVGDAAYERGDQSKPYRYIAMFAPGVAGTLPAGASVDAVNAARLPEKPLEQLPLARDRYAVTAKLAKRWERSTTRVSERLYVDSWGLKASTSDLVWLFDWNERSWIGPHVRVHTQLPVVFWQRNYEVTFNPGGTWVFPALRTGDRELGSLTTLTLGAMTRLNLGSLFDVGEWALTGEVNGMFTHFYDALYVTNRLAGLVSVGVEAQL
jgi:hypothetical protein